MMIGFARTERGEAMISICDNCRYQFSDCKGRKTAEKTECQYYGKPMVFNAKTVVEENARISAALLEAIDELCERCERHRADYWESCNGCKWFDWKGGTK